ncbi:MAG TPA: hypothetical protein VHH73_12600 [Verrucomicrobiae bacterium]|nr:hypothetical protein [Verrucomicrobiae bacterium]
MAWTLEISHLDVVSPGDATLIVARESTAGIVRSLLIDGGRANRAESIDRYLENQGVASLNVMVVTHYDSDHFNGIQALLTKSTTRYDNTIIFDPGEPGDLQVKTMRLSGGGKGYNITKSNQESDYLRYVAAVARRGARQRLTAQVAPFYFDETAPSGVEQEGLVAQGWHACTWLLNQELLWQGVSPIPAGAPRVKCIAVNQYVLKNDTGDFLYAATSGLSADRNKNQRSIGVKVTLNNFKYYAGGDLETTQEDALQAYLNPANNLAGRVAAMKTSHHGSEYSTSDAFLARLKPRLAFVSCGTGNSYGHPTQRVINSLEASDRLQAYYLTGEDIRTTSPVIGASGEVAGVWPLGRILLEEGDIFLTVTEAGSQENPLQMGVAYQQPKAGTNRKKNTGFAYTPYALQNIAHYASLG